jgi:hypothetical protein
VTAFIWLPTYFEKGPAVGEYILAHWRGHLGLARSSLLNGLTIYLLLVVGLVVLGSIAQVQSQIITFGLLVIFLIWAIWAGVGIVRCGIRYAFNRGNSTSYRLAGIAAIIGVAIVAALNANDVLRILRHL